MEDHGDGVISFSSLDEMLEYQHQAHEAAMKLVTDHQRELMDGQGFCWFSYRPDYGDGFTIWGERKSLAEIAQEYGDKAAEYAAKGDHETAEEWRYTIAQDKESLARGYVFGTAYSAWEPDGELGSTHVTQMIAVPRETFDHARECGWSIDRLMAEHPAEMLDVVLRWDANKTEQHTLHDTSEGGEDTT